MISLFSDMSMEKPLHFVFCSFRQKYRKISGTKFETKPLDNLHKGSSAFRRVIKEIVYTVPPYIIHYKRQKTLPEESKRMKRI